MAQPNPKIVVKDYISPIESTRKMLMDEEDSKIQGRRGFIFKGYKTEKERIEETLRNNNFINKDAQQLDSKKKKATATIIQPEMRYKPRTDMERIFDVVNSNNYGRANKDIVYNQLKGLDLNQFKRQQTVDEELLDLEPSEESPFKAIANISRQIAGPALAEIKSEAPNSHFDENVSKQKFNLNFNVPKNINSGAKFLMSDLHYKTHFKGASVIATQVPPPMKSKIKVANAQEIDMQETVGYLGDLIKNSRISFKKNNNPYLIKKMNEFDSASLSVLQQIAFKSNTDEEESNRPMIGKSPLKGKRKVVIREIQDIKENNEEYNKKDDDTKVTIGNRAYNRTDVNVIADKVLHECNFYHNKNKNNNRRLKVGTGKLMMTNGLSINDFHNLYGL